MESDEKSFILKIYGKFQKIVVIVLMLLMMVVVAISVFEMIESMYFWIKSGEIFEQLATVNELREVFGLFLLVLIGIELLETIKMYIIKNTIHVEVVFLVAMIAIARHVIDLDYKTMEPLTLVGISSIIIALTVGYYLLKRSGSFSSVDNQNFDHDLNEQKEKSDEKR